MLLHIQPDKFAACILYNMIFNVVHKVAAHLADIAVGTEVSSCNYKHDMFFVL